ncbi:MAG: hypothetical protein ACM3KM_01970 [Acidobacteriaceae bacterium]
MQYILEIFQLIFVFALVKSFGWLLFLWVGIWVWYKLRIAGAQARYGATLKWIFLEVRIDELNERSPLAMEQIIAALHAIHTGYTWGERFNGKFVTTVSCEIVSLGGRVSFIFKMVDRYRDLFESAVFAQYPKAEIYEVEDYLKHLPRIYDPETAEFDFWGTQMNKRKDGTESCYPIKTYPSFEHTQQKTIIDPLAGVLEVMSNIQPYELLVSQMVVKPVDESWKKATEKILEKLRGNPAPKRKKGAMDFMFDLPLQLISGLANIVLPGGGEAAPAKPVREKEEQPSKIQYLSEGQKDVISAVEGQLAKISYEIKLRLFYLAPKDKFNKGLRVPQIIGGYRNFDNPAVNGLKPDLKRTWTDSGFKYFESLEKPLRDHQKLVRKRKFLTAFKDRDHYKGSGKTILNTEEVATLFHFPQSPNVRVSQLERVVTVKSAPPSDLPIVENM